MAKHSDISSLVELSPTLYPKRWFQILFGCFNFFCFVYLAAFWKPVAIPKSSHITTNDAWRILATEYTLGQPSDIVIVGSSLSRVMKESYFSMFNPKSLTFSGGSSLTGLEVIACHRPLPRIVLVEADILNRDNNYEFVQSYCHTGQTIARGKVLLRQFHPIRMVIAEIMSGNSSSKESRGVGLKEAERLRSTSPKHYDIDEKIHKAVESYKKIEFETITHTNARRMRELVEQLESQGTRVYFFHMPLPDNIRNSRYFSGTESILREELGTSGRWLSIDLRKDELRWIDQGHLDARSAVLMVDAIENAFRLEKVPLYETESN